MKIDQTGTVKSQTGSGKKRKAPTADNIAFVEELTLSQENALRRKTF